MMVRYTIVLEPSYEKKRKEKKGPGIDHWNVRGIQSLRSMYKIGISMYYSLILVIFIIAQIFSAK